MLPLLKDTSAWVTTMLDFYGLPDNFPGVSKASSGHGSARSRVQAVEAAVSEALERPPHFIPFVILHEFETWYFADPSKVADYFGKIDVREAMERVNREADGPENINHGKETHPSKRLERYGMRFQKTSAVTVLKDIGLDAIRKTCHLNAWLTRLEKLETFA